MKLYCATTNPGKLREFRVIVERLGAGGLEVAPLDGMAALPPFDERGATFEENAVGKALYYSRFAPGPLFADDSGLEVDALGGAPGVRSARFSGPGATDQSNNRLLLERLAGVEERGARFVCVAALAEAGRLLGAFRGEVEGRIARAPAGANGFGYDPLFHYPPLGRSFGELSGDEKLEVSHRGRALAALIRFLARRA